ncbi:MAG: hypothetical protein ACHQD8_06440, partial [Chitinophagales bacterium]
LLGLLTVIFSIVIKADYVYLGLLLCLYGMVAHISGHYIDILFSIKIGQPLTDDNMHQISWVSHTLRFVFMVGLIVGLIVLANHKYHFI